MKKLHLHIGSPKTGSTSIQKFLFNNREALSQQGFIYPGKEENHHKFFFATRSPQKDWPGMFKGYDLDQLKKNINSYFESLEDKFICPDSQHIISNELLFIDNKKYIKNIFEYLQQFFSSVTVYLYVREPVSYYRSLQQQKIKSRSYVLSPFEFQYNFKNVIKSWRNFCDIKVIKYCPGNDACESFCNEVGLHFNALSSQQKRVKTSASIEQMVLFEKIQRNLYKNHEERVKLHLKILLQINAPFISKPKLKDWIKPVIQNNHQADLNWLKNEYQIRFNDNYASDNLSDPDQYPEFKHGKASVRDIYKLENEQSVEKYEAVVMDILLKKMLEYSHKQGQ